MTVPPSYSFPSSHAHSSVLQRRRFSRTDALQALHRGNYPPAARGGGRGRGRGGAPTPHVRPPGHGDERFHHWSPKKSNVWIAPALASSKTQVAAAAAVRAEAQPPKGKLEERMRLQQVGHERSNENQTHYDEVGAKRPRPDTAPPPHASTAPASASLLPLWEREIETRQEASRVHARRGEREKWIRNRDALEWMQARVAVVKEDERRQRLRDMEEARRRAEEEHEGENQSGRGEESERPESSSGSGDVYGDDREEGEWEEIEISAAMRKERGGQRMKEEEEAEEALYMHGDAASDVEDLLDYGWGLERSDY